MHTGTPIESEGHDRENLELPSNQIQLLKDATELGMLIHPPIIYAHNYAYH